MKDPTCILLHWALQTKTILCPPSSNCLLFTR
uniref:Uncharacterized protein n=1 Tax=Musa acuminata subsp. malaccensis TaxID=214687 RepID=A0A804U5M9_MUSAM